MSEKPSPSDFKRLVPRVRRLLKEDGFGSRTFGTLELRAEIEKVFDEVSDDEDNSRAAYETLRRLAQRRQHLVTADERKAQLAPHLLGPRHGIAWATLDAEANPMLFETVNNARKHFWGQEGPPFPAFSLGLPAAQAEAERWLQSHSDSAEQSRRAELRLACMAPHIGMAKYEFHEVLNAFSDDPKWRASGQSIGPFLRALADRLEEAEVQVVFYQEPIAAANLDGQFTEMHDYLSLDPNVKLVRVPQTGSLFELDQHVRGVVWASGWWQPWQALHYIMTGYPPSPRRTTSSQLTTKPVHYHLPRRSGRPTKLRMPQIDIAVEGPISRAEWDELLPDIVTPNGRRPHRLKATHVALLQLKAQTPGQNWTQRLGVWERWRKQYPQENLSEYRSERLIRKAWALAASYLITWMSSSDPLKVRRARGPRPSESCEIKTEASAR